MALENSHVTGSSGQGEADFGSAWHNELYVLKNGLGGSLDEFAGAAREAMDHPGRTSLQVGAATAAAMAVGFFARRAGIAGVLAQGAVTALGAQFLLDGVLPITRAAGAGLSASNGQELELASRNLSAGLGRFAFDSLVTLPFAAGGAMVGREIGLATAGSLEASDAVAAARGAQARASARAESTWDRSGRSRSQFASDFARSARTGAGSSWTARVAEPEVLEGEIIDPGPRARAGWQRPSQDIIDAEVIDAEYTVMGEVRAVSQRAAGPLSGRLALPRATEASSKPPVSASDSTSLAVRSGGDSLPMQQIPVELRARVRASSPSEDQIRRALEAYGPARPEPGQILNIRI